VIMRAPCLQIFTLGRKGSPKSCAWNLAHAPEQPFAHSQLVRDFATWAELIGTLYYDLIAFL
jgi:hypothetical protein